MYLSYFKLCKDVELYDVLKCLENPCNRKIEKNFKLLSTINESIYLIFFI
jgi:hypothetical protein